MNSSELLYKAVKYGRHDLCQLIERIRDFEESVCLYEETGEQEYKDIATGRHYHRILWSEFIRRLENGGRLYFEDAFDLKKRIIHELALPVPTKNYCYACTGDCFGCPIVRVAGTCSNDNSAYYKLVDAMCKHEIQAAVTYAKVILEAWDEDN